MPTLRIEGYKFRFYSTDMFEPPHVHVFHAENEAKIWLVPIAVAYSYGYNSPELNRVVTLTRWHLQQLLEAWNAHFSR